jgi:hypothetical protein
MLHAAATGGRSSIAPMTTVTPNIEQETRRAWAEYADRLHGLEGDDYDRAEHEAWEQLQTTLTALDASLAPLDDPALG